MTICINDSCKTTSSLPENYYKGQLFASDFLFAPKPAIQWRGEGLPIVVVNQKNIDISDFIDLDIQNQDLEEGGSIQPDSLYHLYLGDNGNLLHSAVIPTFGKVYATLNGDLQKRYIGSYITDQFGQLVDPITGTGFLGIDEQKRFLKFVSSNQVFTSVDNEKTILEVSEFIALKNTKIEFSSHIVFSSNQAGDEIEIRNNMLLNASDRSVSQTAAIANKRFTAANTISKIYNSFAKDHAKLNIGFSNTAGNVTIDSGPTNIATRMELLITSPLL